MPAARTSSTVLEVEFHPDMSPRPGPLEQGALESPKKLEELDRLEEVITQFGSRKERKEKQSKATKKKEEKITEKYAYAARS